jgi:hypothetical protein
MKLYEALNINYIIGYLEQKGVDMRRFNDDLDNGEIATPNITTIAAFFPDDTLAATFLLAGYAPSFESNVRNFANAVYKVVYLCEALS